MTLATSESRQLGLVKESVRGTAVTPATKWRAITVDSELEYTLNLIDDEAKRGISAKFPAQPGVKTGTGSIKFPVRASHIGEFVQMLLGNPTTVDVGVAGSAVQHTFLAPPAVSVIQPQSFTMYLDRGTHVKRYSLCNASKLTFSGDSEGLTQMEAAVMFKTEDSGGSIGTPVYTTESDELASYQTQLKIDGTTNVQVKSFEFVLENGLFPQRTFNSSQDIRDLLAVGPHKISGKFDIYIEDDTERAKFLAGTQSALRLLIEGEVLEGVIKNTLDINIPKVKYRAFPFGDMDGLLGVSAEFEAEYSFTDSKLADVVVINNVTAY
jgi:hypothetical protein